MSYPNKFSNFKKSNYNNNNKYNNYPYKSNFIYPNYYNNFNNYYNNNFDYNNNYFNNYANYNNNNIDVNNLNDNIYYNKIDCNSNMTYKLLFWNLLCNEYSYDWKTSPKIELKYKIWEHRSKLFTHLFSDKSIISDIYCFVEVDKQDDLYIMLNNIVNQKLFESVYFPRPSTPLGIMLLYNRTKFKIINSYKYLLGNFVNQNFALVSILQELSYPYNIFVVLVTHLTAWEKNENARIKQINKLFYSMANDKNLKNLKINKIIICGDLNTNPSSNCIKQIVNNKFNSVFDISEESKDDGNYTMVIDTVDEGLKKLKFDYIFVNNNIEIINKILPTNFLDFEKGLPNENFPSDHIYLFIEFKFCEKNKEIPYDYNQIIYDHSLNYNISLPNQNQNQNNVNNNKNEQKFENSLDINDDKDNKKNQIKGTNIEGDEIKNEENNIEKKEEKNN
jgi:hypothetical protein